MKEKPLKQGDRVSWNSPGGPSVGQVKKKLTKPTKIKGHNVAASKDNPEYLVVSEKSGKPAAHKATSLRKLS
jgi:hypothetical protein